MSEINNEAFTPEAYLRIKSLDNPHIINKELSKYSVEFKASYVKYGNMLRNKKFRDEKKDIINLKRKEARKLAKSNEEPVAKPFETEKVIINPDEVDKDLKRESKAENMKIKDLNPNSINNYINTIKNIYNKYHNKDIADDAEVLKLLRNEKYDTKKLLKQNIYIVENINDITLKYAYALRPLYYIFCRTRGKNINILKDALYPFATKYQEVYNENRENTKANIEITKLISFEKNEVLKNADLITDVYEKLIYSLLFLMPTRRLYDYRITRIATKSSDINNLDYNWYYQGKIYINNTKNKDMMVLDLPNEIVEIINLLPADTDYILGKSYSESSLSRKFAKITENIYRTPFNAVDIRKLYASYNLKINAETGDTKQMKENARKMGHSLNENLNYIVKT